MIVKSLAVRGRGGQVVLIVTPCQLRAEHHQFHLL